MKGKDTELRAMLAAQSEALAASAKQIERLSGLLERNTAAMVRSEAPAVDVTLVGDVLDRYDKEMLSTNPKWRAQSYQLQPLRYFFGEMRVCDVKPTTWTEYVVDRMAGNIPSGDKTGVKVLPTTANHELVIFRVVLNWAVERELLRENPIAKAKPIPRTQHKKQGSLREEDLAAILEHCPNLLTKVFLTVELDSGLRRTECLTLRWEDVDINAKMIFVRNGKGGKSREVVTTRRAMDFLRRLPMDGEWCFMNRRTDNHYSKATINFWVREAVVASGVEARYQSRKIRNHGMRRGFCTNAVERGIDLRAVQRNLGHESIETTEGYADSRLDHLKRMMAEKFEPGVRIKELPRHGPKRATAEAPTPERLKIVK